MASDRRRLTWDDGALNDLADLAEFMPVAARGAVDAMERMVAAGFNYGRGTSRLDVWYLPVAPLGVFYADVAGVIAVARVVDARRLQELP